MITTKETEVWEALPEIGRNFHKFDRGRLFLIAGSEGMAGAAIMAGRAALRSGVGFLDIAMPKSIYPIVTAAIPEAVCSVYDPEDIVQMRQVLADGIRKSRAVAVGCGLGMLRERVCPIVLEYCDKPLLMDADGLNYLAETFVETESIKTGDLILTPHSGEMGRLIGRTGREVESDRMDAALEAAARYHAAVLLKGPETLIVKEGREAHVNSTGNPGMARAGSGDTLTGIIGALMAQGEDGFTAAWSGAYIHGMAGDFAKARFSERCMLPSDMAEMLPEVFISLESRATECGKL